MKVAAITAAMKRVQILHPETTAKLVQIPSQNQMMDFLGRGRGPTALTALSPRAVTATAPVRVIATRWRLEGWMESSDGHLRSVLALILDTRCAYNSRHIRAGIPSRQFSARNYLNHTTNFWHTDL
jgi:hypothetical protein